MKSRSLAAALVALCAVAAALIAAPTSVAAKAAAKPSASSLLFVQVTKSGSLERAKPGVYRLVFEDVSPSVATFTDRPYRRAGEQGLSGFVHGWAGEGFAADPPNAALVIHGAPSSHDVAMLTISHPRYDAKTRRLAYTAKPLHSAGAKSLAGFSRRGDPLRPSSFGDADLFIDNGGSDTTVHQITLQVNVNPGAEESTTLQISSPSNAVWSLGRPGSRSAGLDMNFPSGAPFSHFMVTPTDLNFQISPELQTNSYFTLDLYVETEADDPFLQLNAVISSGIQINASVNGVSTTWNSGIVSLPLE